MQYIILICLVSLIVGVVFNASINILQVSSALKDHVKQEPVVTRTINADGDMVISIPTKYKQNYDEVKL